MKGYFKEINMVLIEKIKATLLGLVVALAILVGLGFANEYVKGRYSVDSDEFVAVIEYGNEVSLEGLKIVDNRTLGLYRFDVEDDMVVEIEETTTAGQRRMVISHAGKEYVVHFEVKYRVDFVLDGVTVDSQLVGSIDELTLPEAPKDKTGYKFSHWDVDSVGELTANAVINGVYTEIEYPSLDGYKATFGDTLDSVELGSNEHGYWEFIDPAETPVGNAGEREFGVRFVYYGDATVNKYAYVTIDVSKKPYDFDKINDTFYYDGEAHTPYIDGVETIYAGGSNVLPGVYSYSLEIADDNYFGIFEGTYEILKPTVTVTVSSATVAYPSSVPEFTFEVEGFDNVELLGIKISAPEYATQVGEYEIGITYTNENVNYVIHKGVLTVVKGDLEVEAPEISEVTFEDKLRDVEFLGKYLGTWAWESPETVVDSMDGITAYAIFTHDDPNLNPVRVAIQITDVLKKTLCFNVIESDFVYEAGKEHKVVYEIVGGMYPEIYASLTVSGNDPVTSAGTYRKTLVINDSRYEGSVIVELNVAKATPSVDFDIVCETVWQETLRLESILLPDGYVWQNPSYRITESGEGAYAVIFTPDDTENYLSVTGEITVKVAKSALTVAGVLDSYEKTYDTYKFDLKNSGIGAYYTDGELTIQYYKDGVLVDEIVNAGEYLLVVTVSEGKNYLGTRIERAVTVTPATNTQTVLTEQSSVYLLGTDSLVLPENVEGSWSWLESEIGAAGVKTLTAVFTPDENGNYLPRTVEVTLTVAKKTLDTPDVSTTLYYNAKTQTLGLADNELYSVEDNGGKSVGSYTAKLTLVDKDNYQWANGSDILTLNYTILSSDNEFTYLPENGLTLPYLASLEGLTAVAKFGGVKVEYKKAGAPDSEFSETVPTDVGEYVVRYTTTDTNCTKVLTETRTFEIIPIEVVPVPSITDTTLEYNGGKQTATLKDVVDGIYTVTDTGATNAGDVGTVTITIYNGNYVFADGTKVLTLTYEIVKCENSWVKEPSVSSTVTYGETPTVEAQAAYDTVVAYFRVLGSDGEFILGLPTDAGKYEIMLTTLSLNAEKVEARYSVLTISKREIEPPLADGSLVYSGEEQLALGDDPFGIYTVENGKATYVGSYVAIATITDTNYKWVGTDDASIEIRYTIKKAQGSITIPKNEYEFTYSGENLFDLIKKAESDNAEQSALVYTITSYVKFDSSTQLTDVIVGAGRYVVTVTAPESDNYLSSKLTVNVTVGKMALTVPTVSDKVYTGSPINVEVNSNDRYSVSGDTTATEVGEYTVTFTLVDSDNYEWLGSETSVSVSRAYKIGTALNSWVVEPENVTAVYNGKPVTLSAEALHGTVTIVYTLGGEVVDSPVCAGVYNVTITAVADNYSELVAHRTVTITKAGVTAPTPEALTYNGYEQFITITDKNLGVLYTVLSSTVGTKATESATVTLALVDSANYKWDTTNDATVTLSVTIGKANAALDGAPTVNDWTFGDAESLPVSSVIPSQTHFEGITVELLYAYENSDKFVTYEELAKTDGKLNAGKYYVKARVLATSNYNGCESAVATFTVAKQSVSVPVAVSGLVFDGRLHTSGINSTSLYTVSDDGGIATGTYAATLTLTDTTNYEWLGDSSASVTVSYGISKLTFTDASVDNSGKSVAYGDDVSLHASVTADVVGVDFDAYITYLYSKDGVTWFESVDALAEAMGSVNLNTGSYLVKTSIAAFDNWEAYERVDAFTVTRKALTVPTPQALIYNGAEQSAILSTDNYTVLGGSATNVGSYTATLTLTDTLNYEWQGSDLATVEVNYSIAKAKNEWSVLPSLSSSTVTYNDTYTVNGAPLYDTVKYKYKKTTDTEYTLVESISSLPKNAGSYEIVFYTESVNAESISATLYLTINKKSVNKPTALPTFYYDGSEKTHGIEATDGFVVRSSTTAINAGETVSVTLGLVSMNYVWSDGSSADYTITSTVQKATVTLGAVNVPSITYTETPTPTVSVDKELASSLVKYSYSLDKVNYYALSDLTKGGYLPVGTYWVKAYVESSNISYSESVAVSFTVAKATPDGISIVWSGAQSDGLYYKNLLSVNRTATTVTYNGKSVSVAKYELAIDGDFAGADTVYKITVIPTDTDNYATTTFSANVPLKTVATVGFNGTAYGSIEDALRVAKSGDTVWVKTDVSGNLYITESIDIPSGVTLLIPYGDATDVSGRNQSTASTLEFILDDASTPEDEKEYFDIANMNPEKYRKTWVKLAPGVTLTVKGTLEISGEMNGGGGGYMSGHTAGKYGTLELEDGAKIECFGTIKCFGFIENAYGNDNGMLTVYDGGNISMPFVLYDYKGGTLVTAIYEDIATNKTAPFHQYALQNLSIALKMNYGATMNTWCNLNTTDRVNSTVATFIGATSDYFLQLTDPEYSYLEAKYNPETKITEVKIYGGAKLNSFSLTVEALGKKETVNSKDFILGFSWLYQITLDNAEGQDMARYEMLDSYKIMPGASIIVEKGAKLVAGFITIYDDTFVDRLGGYGVSTGIYPTAYPTLSTLRGTKLKGGMLLIRGELEVRDLAGDVYTDTDGAILKVTGQTTISTKEPTIINKGLIFGSVDEHQTIVRSLRLIYVDSYGNVKSQISAIIKTEDGAFYTSDSDSLSWVTDANVEYITITLPEDVRVTIDSVVLVDENGNFAGFGSYDSSLGGNVHVVEGTLVLFHLRADQLVVANGASTLTLDSAGDIKTSAYQYSWSASANMPAIYSGVPVLTLTGYGALSECTVTYKNLGTANCYIEISMKKKVTAINPLTSLTASFSVSATKSTTTGTGSISKTGRMSVTASTTVKVYEDETVTVK